MRYKRMLFDTERVPVACTVRAHLWPVFQLRMKTGCLERPFYFPVYPLLGGADRGFLLSGCGWMCMFCVDQKAL